MAAKLCAVCGSDLPPLVRIDCRYCGVRCRVRAHRLRDEAATQRRERRRGARADKRLRGLLNSAERKLALAQQDNASLRTKLITVERRTSAPSSVSGQRSLASLPNAEGKVMVLRRKLSEARAQIAMLERRMVIAAPAPLAAVTSLRNEIKSLRDQNTVLRGQNDVIREMVTNNAHDYQDAERATAEIRTELSESARECKRLSGQLEQWRQQAEHLSRQDEQVPRLKAEVEHLRSEISERKKEADTLRKERDKANTLSTASAMFWAEKTREEFKKRQAEIQAASDAALERRVERAQSAGWQPRLDPLVCDVEKEFDTANRLAKWQSERHRPVTARRLKSREDAYLLAMRAALSLREHYKQHSRAGLRGIARWRRFDYELDPESERNLVEQTRKRIEFLKQPIQQWASLRG